MLMKYIFKSTDRKARFCVRVWIFLTHLISYIVCKNCSIEVHSSLLFIMNVGIVREQSFVEKSTDCVKNLLLVNHSLSHSLYTVYMS